MIDKKRLKQTNNNNKIMLKNLPNMKEYNKQSQEMIMNLLLKEIKLLK